MLSNIKWEVSYPKKVKTVKVLIIPQDVRDRMSKVTTRDLYLWGRKNGVIKRLPRKIKKTLYYGGSEKFTNKSTNACVKLWNEYDEQTV